LREKIVNKTEEWANIEHERWSKWQEYMFDCAVKSGDDNLGIRTLAFPTGQYENWERQIETPYSELSEKEKESDREQVRPYIDELLKLLDPNKE
jgi:hypothetical protein